MKTATPIEPNTTELVKVKGTRLYFEDYGVGEPLIFLHAYTQSSVAWNSFVEDSSNDYEVYLIYLRGHGKSDSCRRRFSVSECAKDVIDLVKYLPFFPDA